MGIFKEVNRKKKFYTIVGNAYLRDPRLSMKEKGLLTLLFSLSSDWTVSTAGLATFAKDCADSIKTSLRRLEEFGYVSKSQCRGTDGRIKRYDYHISDSPVFSRSSPAIKIPALKKPSIEIPAPGNYPLPIKDIPNKEVPIKEILSPAERSARFVEPTCEEVAEYCRSRGGLVDAEEFCSYYSSVGWRVGKNKMKDWRAAVRTWEVKRKREGALSASDYRKSNPDDLTLDI